MPIMCTYYFFEKIWALVKSAQVFALSSVDSYRSLSSLL